ncbi:MAG: hypothetical protein JWM89_1947 [Acidimicrobiales bacterium]|nr:hypothetical protein [Acidimicrobiales bacterium]
MPEYEVTLRDRTVERVQEADAYQQEGQMTTFFRTASARQVVDTWSTRVASFRTAEVLVIRRIEPAAADRTPTVDLDALDALDALDEVRELDGIDQPVMAGTVTPFVRSA